MTTRIKTLPPQSQSSSTLEEGEIFISEIRHRYIVCRWSLGESVELEPYVDFDSQEEAEEAVERARAAEE
jgi:hypothetical protein